MTALGLAVQEKRGKGRAGQPHLVSEGATALASFPPSRDIKEDVRLHEVMLIEHIRPLSFSHHRCSAADSTCHGRWTQGIMQCNRAAAVIELLTATVPGTLQHIASTEPKSIHAAGSEPSLCMSLPAIAVHA